MVGILFWGANGEITDANDAFLNIVGYSRKDLIAGRLHWRDMTPPEYTKIDDKALKTLAEKGIITPFDKEYIHKSGKRIPITLGAATLAGAKDTGVAFVLDITEKRMAEDELMKLKDSLEFEVNEKTKELRERVAELERFHEATIDRELRMKELRDEIAALNQKLKVK